MIGSTESIIQKRLFYWLRISYQPKFIRSELNLDLKSQIRFHEIEIEKPNLGLNFLFSVVITHTC